MGRDAWFEIYDISPNIKTGKGTTKTDVFREQVGHFLGFHSPPGGSACVLTDDDLQVALKKLQAEAARRRSDQANPPGSNGAGAASANTQG
jgi:hypothetical protein